MLREVLAQLDLHSGQTVVDGTVGGGGHSRAICERIGPAGRLIGLDRDPSAIERARETLAAYAHVSLQARSYVDLLEVLAALDVPRVDRILLDLGLSSDQLVDEARGFGFQSEGPLDLRFDASQGLSAAEWFRSATEVEIADALWEFGDEPRSRPLAAAIKRELPATSGALAELVVRVLGAPRRDEKHPATRVFQAVRIAVNRELDHVERALTDVLPACLASGGRLAVISFHSTEDRLVKQAFKLHPLLKAVEKPICPTPAEIRYNPRCRSAKLRIAQKVKDR